MTTSLREREALLNTSKWAVAKIEQVNQYMSDEDRRFAIEYLQGSMGQTQEVRPVKARGPRAPKEV